MGVWVYELAGSGVYVWVYELAGSGVYVWVYGCMN